MTSQTQAPPDQRVLAARSTNRARGVAKVPISKPLEAKAEPAAMVAFSAFLVARMDTMGLSIAELARQSGADNSTITNLRSGQAKPGVRVVRKLYKALGMSLPELLVQAELIEPEDWPEGGASPALPPVVQDVMTWLDPARDVPLTEKEGRMLQAACRRALESWEEWYEAFHSPDRQRSGLPADSGTGRR